MTARFRLNMLIPLCALALMGCQQKDGERAPVIRAPAATITGEAQSCIPLTSLSATTVHDDYTIDFKVGGKFYRNTLPYQCPSLGFERAFTYATSLTRLCNTDIIYVLRMAGSGRLDRGAGCGLGHFVPITYDKKTPASQPPSG